VFPISWAHANETRLVSRTRPGKGGAVEGRRTQTHCAGLSQEQLAEEADLSPVCISRVECGKENISVDAAMRIAKAVGVRLHELVEGA
jgi:DNA-binding XRE family transcriptional regulator